MASIQKIVSRLTGDTSYRAQARVKGHAAQSATFASRAEAMKWSKSVEAAITEGRYFPQARASRTSFAEAVARYKDTGLAGARERSRSGPVAFRNLAIALRYAQLRTDGTQAAVAEREVAEFCSRFDEAWHRANLPNTGRDDMTPNGDYRAAGRGINGFVQPD